MKMLCKVETFKTFLSQQLSLCVKRENTTKTHTFFQNKLKGTFC